MEEPQQINNRIPYDPTSSTSGNISKGNKNTNSKNIYTPVSIAASFTVAKTWKQPKCPLKGEWIKNCGVYIYNGILFSHKKRGNPAICRNMMDLEGFMLSETSHTQRDKYCMISCGI